MTTVLFLGQKWLGDRCFDRLVHHPEVRACAVVTNPAPTAWWRSNGVQVRAEALGIPTVSCEHRNEQEIEALLDEHRPDAIVSVQHPWIISERFLTAVDGAAFNVHAAKLPEYRGYNAASHVILNGDATHTVTAHWMTAGVDEGDIAFEETIDVRPDETARGLYERSLEAGEVVFDRLLDALAAPPESIPRRRPDGVGRFYPRSSLDDAREIQDHTAQDDVDVRSRALFFPPFEPAYFLRAGRKHYVLPEGFARFAHEFRGTHW